MCWRVPCTQAAVRDLERLPNEVKVDCYRINLQVQYTTPLQRTNIIIIHCCVVLPFEV